MLYFLSGDPRRPYPTDIEMRLGFLGRLSDLPMSGNALTQGNLDMVSRGTHGGEFYFILLLNTLLLLKFRAVLF